jgi:hypothetical protein
MAIRDRRRLQLIAAAAASAILVLAVIADTSAATGKGSQGCPKRSATPTSSGVSGADATLVPDGAVSVLICRYGSLNASKPLSLAASRRLREGAVPDRLIGRLRRLAPVPSGVLGCDNDDGSLVTARFKYPDGKRVLVLVELTGCQIARNGSTVRWARHDPGPTLIRQLRHLTQKKSSSG